MTPNVPPNELPLEHRILTDRSLAIRVVGVGGAGANAVDRLKLENLDRLQLVALDTDHQALSSSVVQEKVLFGAGITRGLSAGGDPELGREAAEASADRIKEVVSDCDLVFLVTGLGGGTGSGAAPVVADLATEAGALVIAFVALPFSFEGGRRTKQAEEALTALRRSCDAVIPLPNDMLLQEGADDPNMLASFARADEWIGRGVKSIWAMLFRTGLINLDFATLRQAFGSRGGKTVFGLGHGVGAGDEAVAGAVASLRACPLLHVPEFSRRADRLLVNITGGTDLTLPKVNELMTAVTEQFGKDSHVIMGAVVDEGMTGQLEVCVIGTSDLAGRSNVRRPIPSTRSRTGATTPPMPAGSGTPVVQGASATNTPEAAATNSRAATMAGAPVELPLGLTASARASQDEFSFNEIESRGFFERTDRTLFEGEDLDKPTYYRRGVKIAI